METDAQAGSGAAQYDSIGGTGVVQADPPMKTSNALVGGGVVFLIQNIMVFATFLMIFMSAMGGGFNAGDASVVEVFFFSFYIDIVAFILLGMALLIYRFGMDTTPAPEEQKPALVGGITLIVWAVFSLLWRVVFPRKAADSFVDLFFNDGGSVSEFMLYIRLTFLFAVINSFLFVVALYYLRKFFKTYESKRGIQLTAPKKHPAIDNIFHGSIVNLIFNLLIFGPILIAVMGGDFENSDSDNLGLIMGFSFLIKNLAVPAILIMGSFGIIQNAKGMIKPFGSTPTGAGGRPGSVPAAGAGGMIPPGPANHLPGVPAPQQPIPQAPVQQQTPLCTFCGQPTTYIEQQGRYYCYSCRQYI